MWIQLYQRYYLAAVTLIILVDLMDEHWHATGVLQRCKQQQHLSLHAYNHAHAGGRNRAGSPSPAPPGR